jgi:hypothetical protein
VAACTKTDSAKIDGRFDRTPPKTPESRIYKPPSRDAVKTLWLY